MSQGDPITSDPSIKGPKCDPKLKKINTIPQISLPNGIRSKTKAASASVQSVDIDTHYEERQAFRSRPVGWTNFGSIKEAAV